MAGDKPVFCPYQIPTNSLPTPTTVGDDRVMNRLKNVVLMVFKKVRPPFLFAPGRCNKSGVPDMLNYVNGEIGLVGGVSI